MGLRPYNDDPVPMTTRSDIANLIKVFYAPDAVDRHVNPNLKMEPPRGIANLRILREGIKTCKDSSVLLRGTFVEPLNNIASKDVLEVSFHKFVHILTFPLMFLRLGRCLGPGCRCALLSLLPLLCLCLLLFLLFDFAVAMGLVMIGRLRIMDVCTHLAMAETP